MRPMFPSWIRSRNCSPRLVYFLAIDTTRRRLASTSSALARSAIRSPSSISATVSRSTVSVSLASSSTRLIFLRAVVMTSDISSISSGRAQRRRGDLTQRLEQLLDRQAGAVLAAHDLTVGLLDALDQLLELDDDLVDLLLGEADLR